MDSLTYNYNNGRNQLNYVDDPVNSANYSTDIDDQASNNYLYDSIGNLVKDVSEEIDSIIWNVYGKIERVVRSSSSERSDLEFRYDAMGNRICKIVKPRTGGMGILDQDEWTYTYYMRDASGNVIATYDRDYTAPSGTYDDVLTLTEDHLYGSSRIGIRTVSEFQASTRYTYVSTTNGIYTGTFSSRSSTVASTTNFNHELGRKSYELSNHLGNVLVTVSDARKPNSSAGTVVGHTAVVKSAGDYYCFGSSMVGRTITGSGYRYQFNGKEKDGEFTEGSLDFGARVYECRLGRWMSIDPLAKKYPHLSPYSAMCNNPIAFIDIEGKVVVLYDNTGAKVATISSAGTVIEAGMENSVILLSYNSSKAYANTASGNLYSEFENDARTLEIHEVNQVGGVGTFTPTETTDVLTPQTNGTTGVASTPDDPTKIGSIDWNPNTGGVDAEGNAHSPTLILVHEMLHAKHFKDNPSQMYVDGMTLLSGYGNNEEKKAIDETNLVSQKLGNGDGGDGVTHKRSSHGAKGTFTAWSVNTNSTSPQYTWKPSGTTTVDNSSNKTVLTNTNTVSGGAGVGAKVAQGVTPKLPVYAVKK